MSKVRSCSVCGKQYKYCPTCSKDPSWKMLYDTEKCMEIANIVSAYNMKVMSKDSAMISLQQVGVEDPAKYKSGISTTLIDILQTTVEAPAEKPKKRRRKK